MMKMAGAAEAAHNKQLSISFVESMLDVPLSFILKLLVIVFCFIILLLVSQF
jgi:hypothetical protein